MRVSVCVPSTCSEYATYINQYETLTFTLAEKKKKSKVREFLANANRDPRLKGVALEVST